MNPQGFVQLNNQDQRPRGHSPPPYQGAFVNQARPTPPPPPPMAQMPHVYPAGQRHHENDFRGGLSDPHPFGRSGPYGPPSPTSRQIQTSRRARPVVHNALERRSQPRTEVYDLRTRVATEEEARDALSTYVVRTIKKDASTNEIDDSGLLVVPTWARAKHAEDTGVSQEEAKRKIINLQAEDYSVSDKKAELISAIQDQLDYAQQLLEEGEHDHRFCYKLLQFHQSIKRVEVSPHFAEQDFEDSRRGGSSRRSRSRDRHSTKEKKKRDKCKKGFYLYESPKSKKSKSKTQRQTESITAYYRRVPRDGINCQQMWEDLQDGVDPWGSPNSSPRFLTQQPFGTGEHRSSQHLGGDQHHAQMGHHQANHALMNRPGDHQGFPHQGHHGMQQQTGFPPQHQFNHQGQPGLGHPGQGQHMSQMQQGQHMPQMQQGFQQQQGPHNQQGFHQPQQPQYAQGQGPRNIPPSGPQGGPQNFDPRTQHGPQAFPPQNGQHPQGIDPRAQGGPQAFPPQNGQGPQPRQGQPGGPPGFDPRGQQGFPHQNVQQPQSRQGPVNGPQAFPHGAGRGQPLPGARVPPNGPQHGPMGRGMAPNEGVRRPEPQRPGQSQQRPNGPPPPPTHTRPAGRGGAKPQVFATSPRTSTSSFRDSEDESGSDSGRETPASSVGSGGRRGRPRHKEAWGPGRSRSRGHDPKVYGASSREHSRAGAPRHRSVSPPVFRPRSAMRNTSGPGVGRQAARPMADDFDQQKRPMQTLNSFDREMLGRAMAGNFGRRTPQRRTYSDDFEHRGRRPTMSDFDQPMPRRRMDGFDEPRMARGDPSHGFRRVSPETGRRAMFEDDIDIMSENFESMRFGGAERRGFPGADRFDRGFRDRFRSREYDDDDDIKRTRFADEGPGRSYGRPMGRTFVNEGPRSFGPRRRGSGYFD